MEEKIREKARIAIRGILEAAEFRITAVEDPFDLAERDGEYILVLCSNDQHEIDDFDSTSYRLVKEGQEISYRKLLFSLNSGISTTNSIVWGVNEFIRYSGEADLARILSRALSLSFAGRSAPGPSDQRITPEGTEAAGQAPSSEEEPAGMVIPHLPIRVTKEAAFKIAKIQGSANLRFLPYWFYTYVSSGEQVYKENRIPFDAEGGGGINAINGIPMDSHPEDVIEDGVPQSAEILQPHLSKEEAVEKISADVITRLTQTVRIKQVKGDAIFYEEKVLKPDRKNIVVDITQVYVPIWQVRGKKIVEVNAFTGEVLSEPMDEGVEIL
ncbi:MAG: hypothetical protein LUQ01_03040 [Methanolinea sp.]|nr:hypothetical protein [Methanolinea sp.]